MRTSVLVWESMVFIIRSLRRIVKGKRKREER